MHFYNLLFSNWIWLKIYSKIQTSKNWTPSVCSNTYKPGMESLAKPYHKYFKYPLAILVEGGIWNTQQNLKQLTCTCFSTRWSGIDVSCPEDRKIMVSSEGNKITLVLFAYDLCKNLILTLSSDCSKDNGHLKII